MPPALFHSVIMESFVHLSRSVILMMLAMTFVHGFNVDVQSVITHRGPPGSMFGFSVAQHKDSNISWILVGAPAAETRQPGIRKAGAVFRCSCESADTCQPVPFDRGGNNVVEGKQIDEKSNQWFGATVRSSGEDGIILACAPRYTWFSTNRRRRDPVGTCFVAKDSFTEFVEYSPCRTARWGYHRQGSCQLGLGADIDSQGGRVFLGAVGSWYWQGQVFMVDSRKSNPDNRVPFYQFLPAGQIYSQSTTTRPDIKWTKEGPNWDDDSYLGYSVVHGEFSGDNESDVAVGMPRGANLTGKVVIYSSDLTNLHNITGEQIGAYFGYALCVMDVDGDGLDDIVVGAPMYTNFEDPAMKIETGKIYVIYQTKRHKFRHWVSIDGTAHKGRFGMALASVGDLNKDGFNDFAVGAPYDGIYGRGAVYIFQGSATGVRKEFTQVIYGESLSGSVSTFGFSLSGGKDLDGNQYPDLLVGSYDSDSVAYFRSKPVVRVKSKLSFTSTQSKQINLEEKRCSLRDSTQVSCLPLRLCMEYDGVGADDYIAFNVQYTLDSKKPKDPRMFFLNHEGLHVINETVRLTKREQWCSNQQVYLRPQMRDKLTSLEAELRYSMIEDRHLGRGRPLPPVIDVTTSTVEKDSISIQKNCGSDNICVPDLRLKVSQSDKSFLMGSTNRIWVDVEVQNSGEDSFEAMLYMTVPPGLAYVNFDRLDNRKDVSILCSAPTPSTNNTLKCDIGNPLPTFAIVHFKLNFQPRHGSEVKSAYEFYIEANSTNPEVSYARADNIRRLSLPIRVQTDTKVFGASHPQPVVHNASHWKQFRDKVKNSETEVGPEVIHVYEIKCDGPSNIEKAEVTILWPSLTLQGKPFMYLLEQPFAEGSAQCDHVDEVNPLQLSIQRHSKFQTYDVHERHSEYDLDTEEGILQGEGRRGSSASGAIAGQDGNSSYQNSSSQREFHTEQGSGSSGGYTRTYNYTKTSRTYSSSSQGESSRSSVFDEYKDEGRTKRSTEEDILKEMSCGPTKCIQIRCHISQFVRNTSVLFWLRGRIWSDTLREDFNGGNVNISSKLITRVTQLPYNVNPEYLGYRKYEIITTVEELQDFTTPAPTPWWIYLLAAIVGLLLLLLIIYVLYKCGFFKRRRRPRGPEGQPLNRNHYGGDERL